MQLSVNKFGGASVKDADGFLNVANIIENNLHEKSIIVVSAMGKTTNALESVMKEHWNGNVESAWGKFNDLKQRHIETIKGIFKEEEQAQILQDLNDLFVELEWMLEDDPGDDFNYHYDQIVSVGELASSFILHRLLLSKGIKAHWLDVRDVVLTSNDYRSAIVDWDETAERIQTQVVPLFEANDVVITQGFLGCTSENFTTTLGREGSDYTAAIFGSAMNSKVVTIWKDVEGIMTADPKTFSDAVVIPHLNYEEALKMCYYGAKVIHPKTLIPLKQRQIPLSVKCFNDVNIAGTLIDNQGAIPNTPVKVVEDQDYFLEIGNLEQGLLTESQLGGIFSLMDKYDLILRVMRLAALKVYICVYDSLSQIELFKEELEVAYDLHGLMPVKLFTIRHASEEEVNGIIGDEPVIMEMKNDDNFHFVMDRD